MAEYIRTTSIAVPVGSAVTYTDTVKKGCCNIRHRAGSGLITVKGGSCCNPNTYRVTFHGNVRGVQGAMQLGIYLDGELLPETLMSVYGTGTTPVYSVDATTEILVCGCCANISVRVIEGALTVDTAAIIVDKEN